jgi:hypothetical protein
MYERPRAKAFRLVAEEGSRHTMGIRPFGALKYHGDPEIALNPRLPSPTVESPRNKVLVFLFSGADRGSRRWLRILKNVSSR